MSGIIPLNGVAILAVFGHLLIMKTMTPQLFIYHHLPLFIFIVKIIIFQTIRDLEAPLYFGVGVKHILGVQVKEFTNIRDIFIQHSILMGGLPMLLFYIYPHNAGIQFGLVWM